MVSERIAYVGGDISTQSMEYYSGNSSCEMINIMLNQRRTSGSIPQKSSSQLSLHSNLPRRYSMQCEGSHYLSPANLNSSTTAQSRFQCIQKPPLRNVLSAPTAHISSTNSRQLPQPPLIQRQDNLAQSMESVESAAVLEPARYKTELCRPFEETGQCRYGAKCQFAHGMQELRSLNRHPKYKTELCRTFHTTAFCSYGQRCNFIHNDEERRGPPPATPTPQGNGRSPVSMMLPISAPLTITSTGDSPASSVTSGSPTQSPSYLNDDTFVMRHSPTPSFGSDGASLASTYTPPASPKHEMNTDHLSSPLDMGLSLSLFSQLSL